MSSPLGRVREAEERSLSCKGGIGGRPLNSTRGNSVGLPIGKRVVVRVPWIAASCGPGGASGGCGTGKGKANPFSGTRAAPRAGAVYTAYFPSLFNSSRQSLLFRFSCVSGLETISR